MQPGMVRPGAPNVPGRGQTTLLDLAGTVEAVMPGGLQIVLPTSTEEHKEIWQLVFGRDTKLELIGKAMPDVLRPGMIVSFTAEIDKKTGKATEKVAALVICSSDQKHQLGVFPEGFGPEGLAEGETGGAAGQPAGTGFGVPLGGPQLGGPQFDAPGPRTRNRTSSRRTHRPVENELPVERFEVCGRISSITKTGEVTVVMPNTYFRVPVKFELAENPDISLEMSGREALAFIQKGAKVTGKGVQFSPVAAQVKELTIELVEPLTLAQPKRETRNNEERAHARTPASRERAGETGTAEKDKEEAADSLKPPTAEEPAVESPKTEQHTPQAEEGEKESPSAEQDKPAAQSGESGSAPQKAAGIDLPPNG